jgi:hypothetical protein
MVLALLASLSEKDKDVVRAALNVYPDPCKLRGHSFTELSREKRWFGLPDRVTVWCRSCGLKKEL